MSEETVVVSDAASNGSVAAVEEMPKPPEAKAEFSSPPPAANPPRIEPDPSRRLHELARELMRTRNRTLMLEYLRLRAALR